MHGLDGGLVEPLFQQTVARNACCARSGLALPSLGVAALISLAFSLRGRGPRHLAVRTPVIGLSSLQSENAMTVQETDGDNSTDDLWEKFKNKRGRDDAAATDHPFPLFGEEPRDPHRYGTTCVRFEGKKDPGVFVRLTNAYCICGDIGSESFVAILRAELGEKIPVVLCDIGGLNVVGRLTVGNKRGLLVPWLTTDRELLILRNELPDDIVVERIDERLNCLGNIIACNDHVAVVHPDVSEETEELVAEVLGVEVFRSTIAGAPNCGSFLVMTNQGGLIQPRTPVEEVDQLAELLEIPLQAGTVNRGCEVISQGVLANDFAAFTGKLTTAMEESIIESTFNLIPDSEKRHAVPGDWF